MPAPVARSTSVAVEALFERGGSTSDAHPANPRRFTYPRDPKVELYINLALAAGATYLVSRDNDLLDLMRWDTEEGRAFQKRFRFLKIVDPVAFLNEIEAQSRQP